MAQLIVDKNKCKKDGICEGECPIAIIKLKDGDGFPELVPGGDEMCLVCGHCVAVCPHGAMSHDQVQIEDSPAIDKNLVIDEYQAVQFLRSRRSIRFFKDETPDKATLQRLIEISRYAPTAGNSQLVSDRSGQDQRDSRDDSGLDAQHIGKDSRISCTIYSGSPKGLGHGI